MRRRTLIALLAAGLLGLAGAGSASATDPDDQHGSLSGHLPASSQNVELVGKLRLTNVADGISDVSALGNHAYLGAFRPECGSGGVHVVNVAAAASPQKVAFIPSHPNVYVGEGVHVIRMNTTAFRGDVLVHNNEPCNTSSPWRGGVSIWDVTNPASPQPLKLNFGDSTPAVTNGIEHATHSVQAWTTGNRAFVAMTDNTEAGGLDVDIVEITDPRNPVLIAETGFPQWPTSSWQLGRGGVINHHDMQVEYIDGHWYMLVSYWDAGHILLNVDNPASPTFVGRNGFLATDPLSGFSPPEGNAHQAYWSSDKRWIIGTDEDFAPYRLVAKITSGPFAGTEFTAQPARGIPQVTPEDPLVGPTVYVGRACGSIPAALSPDAIAVVERGDCSFQAKATNVNAARYAGGIVFNGPSAGQCETLVNMLVTTSDVPMLFVARSTGYKILGITGYNPANCPGGANPALPAVGTAGESVDIRSLFDGWGYVRLIDAQTLQEVDQYAIPEAFDEDYAQGFGNLTVHEVKTDPRRVDRAYLSYYSGGLRVLDFGGGTLREVGHFIDVGGNDFWGIFPLLQGQALLNDKDRGRGRDNEKRPLLLMSDRDFGLYVLRYTGKE